MSEPVWLFSNKQEFIKTIPSPVLVERLPECFVLTK